MINNQERIVGCEASIAKPIYREDAECADVNYLVNLKPDSKYSEYLIESDMLEFLDIRTVEYELRKQYSKLFRKLGFYNSDNKLYGNLPVNDFLFAREKNESVNIPKELEKDNYLHSGSISLLQYSNEMEVSNFLMKIPEQHRTLFIDHKLSKHFCAAGGSVLDSIKYSQEQYNGDIDIFPLSPVDSKEHIKEFIEFISEDGYVEYSRNKHAINIVWYSDHGVLLRRILFWWVDLLEFSYHKITNYVKNIGIQTKTIVNRVKMATKESQKQYDDMISKHLNFKKLIYKSGYIYDMAPKLCKDFIDSDLVDKLDLPQNVIADFKVYLKNLDIEELFTNLKENINTSFNRNYYDSRYNDDYYDNIFAWKSIDRILKPNKTHYQIILQRNSCILEVLSRFDVDCCCIAFYQGKIYQTKRFQHSIDYRANVIDPTRQSPSYEYRLMKYTNRGFGIIVPSLDKYHIINKPYYLTMGLSRLIAIHAKELDTKSSWYGERFMDNILVYDGLKLLENEIVGWLETGDRARASYDQFMMSDTAELIGSIDSKTTPFYFSAYVSDIEMKHYLSQLNDDTPTNTNLITQPNSKLIELQGDSKKILDKYLEMRCSNNIYKRKYKVSEYYFGINVQSMIQAVKWFGNSDLNSDYLSNGTRNKVLEDTMLDLANTYFDSERYIERYTNADDQVRQLLSANILTNISGGLITCKHEKRFKPGLRSVIYNVYPIVSTIEELKQFITNTNDKMKEILGKDGVILCYTRTNDYLDINFYQFEEGSRINIAIVNRIMAELSNMMDNSTSIPNSVDPWIFELNYLPYESINITMLRRIILIKDFFMKHTSNLDLRLRKLYEFVFKSIEDELQYLESYGESTLSKERKYMYNMDSIFGTIRIHYKASSTIEDAFKYIDHSFDCVGVYNGDICYNDRYRHYMLYDKIVLDPAFRRGKTFENIHNITLQTHYFGGGNIDRKLITPYSVKDVRVWRDLKSHRNDLKSDGNYHEFLLNGKMRNVPQNYDRDRNWYGFNNIYQTRQHNKVIAFEDEAMLTTNRVSVSVYNDIAKKNTIYYVDFEWKLEDTPTIGDYYEAIEDYGKMAFLNYRDALAITTGLQYDENGCYIIR